MLTLMAKMHMNTFYDILSNVKNTNVKIVPYAVNVTLISFYLQEEITLKAANE